MNEYYFDELLEELGIDIDSVGERKSDLDIQRDATEFFASVKEYPRKRISPTMLGNCERKGVLMTIPQPNEWQSWSEVYAKTGNALEDFIADVYEGNIGNRILRYLMTVIPEIAEEEAIVRNVVTEAVTGIVTRVLKKNFGVGNLIAQDVLINIKDLNVYSKSDLFIDVDGRFTIAEVKSLGDTPFNFSPFKRVPNEKRLEALYKKKYDQITQLLFYTSLLGADGSMIYVSRNAQKGNGSKNSPKYLNATNIDVPFNLDDAMETVARLHFTRIAMEQKLLPPVPEHMKPKEGNKTSARCGFCQWQSYCHGEGKYAPVPVPYPDMKPETVEALWKRCYEFAQISLSSEVPEKYKGDKRYSGIPTLTQTRRQVHDFLSRKRSVKMSFKEFNSMFEFQGIDKV